MTPKGPLSPKSQTAWPLNFFSSRCRFSKPPQILSKYPILPCLGAHTNTLFGCMDVCTTPPLPPGLPVSGPGGGGDVMWSCVCVEAKSPTRLPWPSRPYPSMAGADAIGDVESVLKVATEIPTTIHKKKSEEGAPVPYLVPLSSPDLEAQSTTNKGCSLSSHLGWWVSGTISTCSCMVMLKWTWGSVHASDVQHQGLARKKG